MKSFKLAPLANIWLQARFILGRLPVMSMLACLLFVAGLIGWLVLVPKLQAHAVKQQIGIAQVKQTLQSTEGLALTAQVSVTEARMMSFYESLGERRYAEQQIKTLFAIANRSGLSLDQAEYKSAYDKYSKTNTFQIILPVKGSYSAIRQFCEKTLLAIPFASLDEMNFKRDTIANRTLEAKLRFTLYLADAPATGKKMAGL